MATIPSYTRGKVARLTATFNDNNVPVDPTNLQVTIYYGSTVKVAASAPTRVSTGHYYKDISIASDWDLDYYAALWTGTYNSVNFKRADIFYVTKEVVEGTVDVPSDAYCTVGDVIRNLRGTNYFHLPNIENDIADIILDMEERVDRKTDQHWKPVTERVYLDGSGTAIQIMPRKPITAVSSCSIRITPNVDYVAFQRIRYTNTRDIHGVAVRSASADSDVQDADLIVDCTAGALIIPERVMYLDMGAFPVWDYTFRQGNKNVVVNYTAGYTAAARPNEITDLCANLVAIEVLEMLADWTARGTVGRSLGGVSTSYGSMAYAARIDRLTAHVEEVVASLRHLGVN